MMNKAKFLFIVRVSIRYLLSKRSGTSRLINLIACFGLVLGLTLLIVVLSVLNGTRDEIDNYIFGVFPHAIARVSDDQAQLLDELRVLPGVVSIERFVDLRALVNTKRKLTKPQPGISVYGFDTDSSNRTFRRMYSAFKEQRDLPIAGLDYQVASAYGLSLGDTFTITVPLLSEQGVTSKTVAFRYAHPLWLGEHGRFSEILYVQIADLLAYGLVSENEVHYRITLDEPKHAVDLLGEYPEVATWTEHFGSFYQALAMEKTVLFILLLFIIGLVTMNVIAGQAMLINRKSSDIAILQTMGAELRWISIVFMFQGAVIVVSGVIVGTILGVIVAHYAHDIMQLFPWGGRSVTLHFETATVAPQDLVWTTLAALVVGSVAILRPLNLIFKKDPVASLSRMV